MNPIRFRFLAILLLALTLSAHLARADDTADNAATDEMGEPVFTTATPKPVPGKVNEGSSDQNDLGEPAAKTVKANRSAARRKIPYSSLSPDERELLDSGEITDGQYIGGGLVSIFVGLGIGQMIEGRYLPSGLIITVGEVASLGMIIGGATDCVISSSTYPYTRLDHCSSGLLTAGVIGFVGFRIWEIIDAWVGPPLQNQRYHRLRDRVDETASTHFMLTPVTNNTTGALDGGQFAVQFRF